MFCTLPESQPVMIHRRLVCANFPLPAEVIPTSHSGVVLCLQSSILHISVVIRGQGSPGYPGKCRKCTTSPNRNEEGTNWMGNSFLKWIPIQSNTRCSGCHELCYLDTEQL